MSVNRIRDVRLLDRFTCSQRFRGGENGILNRGIARTTAESIFECKANLIARRIRIPLEQRTGGHDLPGDAESALHRAMFHEGFLQWVEPRAPERASGPCERRVEMRSIETRRRSGCCAKCLRFVCAPFGRSAQRDGCQTFNRHNRLPIRALGGIHAREHGFAIDKHSTRAALGFITADLCASEAQSFAEERRECLPGAMVPGWVCADNSKGTFGVPR